MSGRSQGRSWERVSLQPRTCSDLLVTRCLAPYMNENINSGTETHLKNTHTHTDTRCISSMPCVEVCVWCVRNKRPQPNEWRMREGKRTRRFPQPGLFLFLITALDGKIILLRCQVSSLTSHLSWFFFFFLIVSTYPFFSRLGSLRTFHPLSAIIYWI